MCTMSCLYVTIVANGGQHASKKLKMMKQGMDISQEASHVASHLSNMANPAKVIKIITNNKDRGRKVKALKVLSFHHHIPFSLFAWSPLMKPCHLVRKGRLIVCASFIRYMPYTTGVVHLC